MLKASFSAKVIFGEGEVRADVEGRSTEMNLGFSAPVASFIQSRGQFSWDTPLETQ
jgi:hypothetical protein